MSSNEKKENRKKRGQISPDDIISYLDFSTESLIEMLKTDNPREITISAVILGNRGDENAIKPLCTALENEKSLYSRIAMSEALSQIGEPAVVYLIEFLGEIGKNQEIDLPLKYFKKKSFPLVRDMAARTLVRIGRPATPYLMDVLENGNEFKTQQAIDALGAIAAKTGDKRALTTLIARMEQIEDLDLTESVNDPVTLWKIIRALSGFRNNKEASNPLIAVLNSHHDPPIIWEALRSLGQIQIAKSDNLRIIQSFIHNENHEIRVAARDALKREM